MTLSQYTAVALFAAAQRKALWTKSIRNTLKRYRPRARPGGRVRVTLGPFAGHIGLFAGMKPRARVEVLLSLLGASQRITLAADGVEAV